MQKTIFLVDGSTTINTVYKAILENEGFRVKTHRSGESCLMALSHSLPDLLLIGAELPDMDCVELASKIKSYPKNILVPIIVVSSLRSSDLKRRCFQMGVTDFILKSCSQEFLIERVKSVLKRKDTLNFNQHLSGQRFHVLVAEDSKSLLALYEQMFEQMGCDVTLCEDGRQAWTYLQQNKDIDLILTDIEMPELNGRELNHLVRSSSDFDQIPIIVVTRLDQQELLCELLSQGANDFIAKPFNYEELEVRVSTHLRTRQLYREQERLNRELKDLNNYLEDRVRERTQELYEANIETITKLARVCDYKDQETGNHIHRVKAYCEELGRAIGLSEEVVSRLGYSSMMHDVGKITTPDEILNKPGPLDQDEWSVMRQHVTAGAELLGDKHFFSMAREIAMCHHERVDGHGYPRGLVGDQIPLSARIVAVVDVFDALVSKRSYKDAWSDHDAIIELRKIAGHHLDKRLVEMFINLLQAGKLSYIRKQYPQEQEIGA